MSRPQATTLTHSTMESATEARARRGAVAFVSHAFTVW
jgi:hypothetical protein